MISWFVLFLQWSMQASGTQYQSLFHSIGSDIHASVTTNAMALDFLSSISFGWEVMFLLKN